MKATKTKAVCLLSGGLDSATACAIALQECAEVKPILMNYNQRHLRELAYAHRLCEHWRLTPVVLNLQGLLSGSALTRDMPVPLDGSDTKEIPDTYVPGRNAIFLMLAASIAEISGATRIYVGFNQFDYSVYPDCRESFVIAMNDAIARGFKSGFDSETRIKVVAPLINDTKADIIRRGCQPPLVPYAMTWSCYSGAEPLPCGRCDSCRIRSAGFKEAGVQEPTPAPLTAAERELWHLR